MRKFIHPGQAIGLALTAEERQLLAEDCLVIDNTYLQRIKEVVTAEVPFTLDELEDFSGQVAFEANHNKKKRNQKALDQVFEKTRHLLLTHTDNAEEARKDALKPSAVAGINPHLFDPAGLLMAELHAWGLDAGKLAASLKPTIVRATETLPVRMSAAEKELVLGLPELEEPIRMEIRQTPPGKRTVALTLGEVTLLNQRVAAAIFSSGDKTLTRKWQTIEQHLSDVQARYADENEPENAVEGLLEGKPVPPAVAARQLLMEVLQQKNRTPPKR